MTLTFLPHPGARERHLQRRAQNPLFSPERRSVTQEQIEAARQLDAEEVQQRLQDLQGLVQEAVDLEPTVESDVILNLKERLDQTYERFSSLAGDQAQARQAIIRLIAVVMNVVRQHAQGDPLALQKLDEEDLARETHFALQNQPLVADLMREDGIIPTAELVPSLLSDSQPGLAAALPLFDPEQRAAITLEARALLASCEATHGPLQEARRRLEEMEAHASMPFEALLN